MERHADRRRSKHAKRRELIARWRDADGDEARAGLLAVLRAGETSTREALATPRGATEEYEPPPGADLRGLDLSGENLDGTDLSGARLQGANLARASLRGAKLTGADLRDTLLRNTDFMGADLRGASFVGALIERTIFGDADLRGASIDRPAIVVGTVVPPSLDVAGPSLSIADFPDELAWAAAEGDAE